MELQWMKNAGWMICTCACLLWNCSPDGGGQNQPTAEGKCPQGKPVEIFSDTMATVTSHTFEAQGQDSHETAILRNGLKVEILQSGCEKIKQEFRFTQKGDHRHRKDDFWIRNAALTIKGVSEESPPLGGLGPLGDEIMKAGDQVRIGEPFHPDLGISMTVDRIVGETEATIIIKLEQG